MRSRVLMAAVLLALSTMLGCASDPSDGWAMGGGFQDDVKTIAVPVWDNQTFVPGLGAELTEALISEIQRTTPWLVVSSGANTTLTGVIRASDLRKLSTDNTTGLVQELAVDLAVDFEWRTIRGREPLVARTDFRSQASFIPTNGIGEPIEVGQRGAVEAMARDIVSELRSDW